MFSSKELKVAYECAIAYPKGHGFSFFFNKKITKAENAVHEININQTIAKFGWPFISIFTVGEKDLLFIIHKFPEFIELTSLQYCTILNENPEKIAKIISKKHRYKYGELLWIYQ